MTFGPSIFDQELPLFVFLYETNIRVASHHLQKQSNIEIDFSSTESSSVLNDNFGGLNHIIYLIIICNTNNFKKCMLCECLYFRRRTNFSAINK